MAELPCYCPHCGTVFTARNIIAGGYPATVTFKDSKTNCPNCGQWANIVDGEFFLQDDNLTLRSGPPLTRAVVQQLQRIAQRVRDAEITPKQAVEEASRISPDFGHLMEKYAVNGILVLLSMIAIWLAYDGNTSSSKASSAIIAELQRQTELVQQAKQQLSDNEEQTRATPTEPKAKPEVIAEKPKSTRRRDVNSARRNAQKLRHSQFGRSNRQRPR